MGLPAAVVGPEGVAKAAIGLPAVLADLFDDDEQPAEEDSSGTQNPLDSLIDKASQAIDDLGSRLEGAANDLAMGDADGDKLTNLQEIELGKDRLEWDTDGDGDADGTEHFGDSDPLKKDSDGDGRTDFQEHGDATDPRDKDDYDTESPVTEPIAAETSTPIHDAYDFLVEGVTDTLGRVAGFPDSDPDNDGLTVRDELARRTNPLAWDTDGDTLSDGFETHMSRTDPLKYDSDGDQLSDGHEDRGASDPLNPDTDGDGVLDGLEHIAGTLGQSTGRSDDGSGETGEPFLARATGLVGDLGAAVIDGALAAPSVAERLIADVRSEIPDGLMADIMTGVANADPGQI